MIKKKNNSFEEIWNLIKSSNNIIMTLHPRPDGDSLGSNCAMKYVLEKQFGKKVRLISPDPLESVFNDLSYSNEVEFGVDLKNVKLSDYDLVLCVDCAVKAAISSLDEDLDVPENVKLINIDHHATNPFYGDLNYIDIEKASASNVLVEFFRSAGVKFDRELGKRLLLGICTDGGFFTYDMNPEGAMADAVYLFEHGVDYVEDVLRPVKYRMPLKRIKTVALYVNKLKSVDKGNYRFGYSVLSEQDINDLGLNETEIRGPINELQYIDEFDFIFSLTETKKYIKGSFRSKKGIDVSRFAKELGGGGHKPAAAFNLERMDLDSAVEKVIQAIEKVGIYRY